MRNPINRNLDKNHSLFLLQTLHGEMQFWNHTDQRQWCFNPIEERYLMSMAIRIILYIF